MRVLSGAFFDQVPSVWMGTAVLLMLAFPSVPVRASADRNPVVVVAGGFESCKFDSSGTANPFESNFTKNGSRLIRDMADDLEIQRNKGTDAPDAHIDWLFSCFDSDGNVFFRTSTNDLVGQATPADLSSYFVALTQLSDNYRKPLSIIGHSHGGWLAMRVAAEMDAPLMLANLFTVDPISFEECTADTFYDAIDVSGTTPWAGFGVLAPCQRAPRDIGPGVRGLILSRLKNVNWVHYYQTYFVPLHSGPFPAPNQPTLSQNLDAYVPDDSWMPTYNDNAHIHIAALPIVWSTFRKKIESILYK